MRDDVACQAADRQNNNSLVFNKAHIDAVMSPTMKMRASASSPSTGVPRRQFSKFPRKQRVELLSVLTVDCRSRNTGPFPNLAHCIERECNEPNLEATVGMPREPL